MKNVKMLLAIALLAGAGQWASAQQAPRSEPPKPTRDQLRAAVQEICPVTGNKLGTHGTPVKVKVGQETVFLCCQGCQQGKVNPEHWATIHANIATAQTKCPVMTQDLPASPKWTIVEGQIVYVCCPPCTKKIEADPESHLAKVDEFYLAALKARQEKAKHQNATQQRASHSHH